MSDISIQFIDESGEYIGNLRSGAMDLIQRAETLARSRSLTKHNALIAIARETIAEAGFRVGQAETDQLVCALSEVRAGKQPQQIQVRVPRPTPKNEGQMGGKRGTVKGKEHLDNTGDGGQLQRFFELERDFPDDDAKRLYDRLYGLDEHKRRLLIELEMLLYPAQVEGWSRKHHGRVIRLCELQQARAPLIILEGDVGTGKTALAETIGDALARRMQGTHKVHLLKVNTQVRGTGQVGEMSDLIVQAFAHAERRTTTLGEPVLLLIDEADALAASRDTQQMHHEDRAGLDTLLQRLDNLRISHIPMAVVFITNRPDALDPAIRRRAALDLSFDRPDNSVRSQILSGLVPELNLRADELEMLVALTGEKEPKNKGIAFTASDLTERLLAGALREAYSHDKPLTFDDLLSQARALSPTPPMGGNSLDLAT